MCGVAGLVAPLGDATEYVATLDAMADAMSHRGPDDAGVVAVHDCSPAVVLAHRRLAIIDLSPSGHQPMHDPDTGNWITFNGEIYNYLELRGELEALGQLFRTRSDTEVILKAYAVWGPDCTRHLRGIFAFGIWAGRSRTLLLARDQLGVKPLYYWRDRGALVFASEVRALLASGLVVRRLDVNGLRSFLAYGSVQEPLTLVQGIQSLLPGHTLTWYNGQISTQRYWKLPDGDQVAADVPRDVHRQVAQRLYEAVRLQLRADVPLGVFLSGGIDSTAIAALAQDTANRAVSTFSVVFGRAAYDERHFSRLAARHLGTNHTELSLTGDMVRKALPEALTAFDQPSVDGLNSYFVSKLTREAGVTVAMSGVGGDEAFGGYDGHRKVLLAERWAQRAAHLPAWVRILASSALEPFAARQSVRKASLLLRSPADSYFTVRLLFVPRQINRLLHPDIEASSTGWISASLDRLRSRIEQYDPINRASALELQSYLLSTLLRDTDQMSMAHALEVRVPLLDHELIEYLFTLPGRCKVSARRPKPLLIGALDGRIPAACIYRPKRGFELPFAMWLREDLQEDIRNELVERPSMCDLPFARGGMEQIWADFAAGRMSWSRVWALFVLRRWLSAHRVTM